jgi:DNA modification methylase
VIHQGHVLEILPTLPAGSVQCCVTSPPYWGLRDYGVEGQLGLEPTPEEYVANMVEVFREIRRVLRDDGTLWLNLGDSYAQDTKWGGKTGGKHAKGLHGTTGIGRNHTQTGLPGKNLVGIPWRVAFALQADGWFLRQDIIWHKPNPMPEAVRDRCTKAHEYIFLLSKSPSYFYDLEAIKEPASPNSHSRGHGVNPKSLHTSAVRSKQNGSFSTAVNEVVPDRNKRSVWKVSTKPYPGAHFATFPPDLIEPCILAGTSEAGCCGACGAPRRRITEKERKPTRPGTDSKVNRASADPDSPYHEHSGMVVGNRDPQRHCTVTTTTGWEPGCDCGAETVPCVVLDPFAGSGTVPQVCNWNGRDWVAIELNPEYVELIETRSRQPRHVEKRPVDAPGQMRMFDGTT